MRKIAKLREGTKLVLCRDNSRIALFLTVGDAYLNPCGSPNVDWRYCSPKSIMIEIESRYRSGAHVIEVAENLQALLKVPLEDKLRGCDVGTSAQKGKGGR